MPQALIPIAIAVAASVAGAVATQALMPDAPDAPDPTLPPPPPPEVLNEEVELRAEDDTDILIAQEQERRRDIQRRQSQAFGTSKSISNINKPKSLLGGS